MSFGLRPDRFRAFAPLNIRVHVCRRVTEPQRVSATIQLYFSTVLSPGATNGSAMSQKWVRD